MNKLPLFGSDSPTSARGRARSLWGDVTGSGRRVNVFLKLKLVFVTDDVRTRCKLSHHLKKPQKLCDFPPLMLM